MSLCKRRGFIFQSSEIYGGAGSVWDYGPLGVELKKNVKDRWWHAMVRARDDIEGLDAAILMHPRVWEASGHVAGFTDPMIDCRACKARFRADKLEDSQCARKPSRKPGEYTDCDLTEPRLFILMLKTTIGPVEDSANIAYLRPETAQGIYVNFLNVQQASRQKIPFGIAQIGKAFRNEITPGNFIFRTREFEQMELEFFVEPGSDQEWHQRWIDMRRDWYLDLGLREENVRLREHGPEELAHYAKRAVDIEYKFPFGWSELEGIANRADFDLSQHQKFSGQDLSYHDQETDTRYIPYVVEPSAGADRSALAFLVDAFREEEAPTASGGTEKRTVLRFDPRLAPIKVAVLPLSRNEQLNPMAREVAAPLRERWMIDYDDARSIGRRYRRQDEIGTPFCVTVDFDSLQDRAVTVRDRDTMTQDRVGVDRLVGYLEERLPR